MARAKIKNENNEWIDLTLPPGGDTLPIGSIVEFIGDTIPYGYELYEDGTPKKIKKVKNAIGLVGKVVTDTTSQKEDEVLDVKTIIDYVNNKSKITKITTYEMLNNCEIIPEVEPFRFLKNGNIILLNCVIRVPNTFDKNNAVNVMKIPNNLAPTDHIYKLTGVGSTSTFGYRIDDTATLILMSDGTIKVRVLNDDIKYVIVDLMWILDE